MSEIRPWYLCITPGVPEPRIEDSSYLVSGLFVCEYVAGCMVLQIAAAKRAYIGGGR